MFDQVIRKLFDANQSLARIMVRGAQLSETYAIETEKKIQQLDLQGWMRAAEAFVEYELEGPREKLELFISTLYDMPAVAHQVDQIVVAWVAQPRDHKGFQTHFVVDRLPSELK